MSILFEKFAGAGKCAVLSAMLALPLLATMPASAQTVADAAQDDSVLKQVIIFGRHGVRSAAEPNSVIQYFASRPYPDFGVPTGYLTPHGAQAETLLGTYFRNYLLEEGLLTGNDAADATKSYFRANSIQRSNVSAADLATGLLPGATVGVHSYALGTPDPIFDPILAGVVTNDGARAARETAGTFGSGAAVKAAYNGDLSLIRSVLFDYPNGTLPLPATPAGKIDPTALPIELTANTSGIETSNVIKASALIDTLLAADPFVMEYTDGLPLTDVAWGQLTPEQLSEQTRIITEDFKIELGTPFLSQLQSSNALAHILRSMEQGATGQAVAGAFAGPQTKLYVINSSDAYVYGVAALLKAHWNLPGYQPDYCAPGGSLVFELRQSNTTGKDIVRVFYTAQTFDQLRNLTPLTVDAPPATQQLLVPGGHTATTLDLDFDTFKSVAEAAINNAYVQNPSTENPPGILTGVPLN
jgi:4-phytase/acid phosphatase